MSTFNLLRRLTGSTLDTHSLELALAEVAEAYLRLRHDDIDKSSAAVESARNICLELASREVADQAAAVGSAALPVTIPKTEPPRVAQLLVCCLGGRKKRYRRALFDDFDEDFQCDLSKGMAVDRARRRYWGRALRSQVSPRSAREQPR